MSPDTGIGLGENFDLVIDNSGDVASYSDLDEMKKDLSGQLTLVIEDEIIGTVLTRNKIVEAESSVRSVLENDERVTDIVDISIQRNTVGNLAQVSVTVDSIYGGLQFNVD